MLFQPLAFLSAALIAAGAASCPTTTAAKDTKPLYLLTLVPFPDSTPGAGWDRGLGTVPGARVARDEINNRTDLLPGYHIELIVENIEACSRAQAAIGLTNLVKSTVNPPCRPVVAVTGLMCSSHTSVLSPVAGHEGIDLIQLSLANSPIFRVQNVSRTFPHLWRVLGAGTIYTDAMVALMVELGWNQVGILFDQGSAYFTHVANHFQKQIQKSEKNKTVVFSTGFHKLTPLLTHQIVTSIREREGGTVVFVAMNDRLAAQLLCQLQRERLTYPGYIWVQIGKRLNRITEAFNLTACEKDDLIRAKEGHIQLDIRAAPSNVSELLVSGERYSEYRMKYNESFQMLKKEYSMEEVTYDTMYSNLLYDQVWALALALNNSVTILKSRDLSIENYTIGQPEITHIIEKELAKVTFQGASGKIMFNEKREVQAIVDIYQVNGSKEVLVGSFVPHATSNNEVTYNLTLIIDENDVPDDEPEVVYVLLPVPAAAVLFSAAGLTILIISTVLILLIYFREWPEVKATSPFLSTIMFLGCYLLSVGVMFRTSCGVTRFDKDSGVYGILISMANFCESLGLTLLVATTFFKLLRVHHFFSNMTLKLKHMWKSCSLLFLALSLSLLISSTFIIVDIVFPVHPSYFNQSEIVKNVLIHRKTLQLFPAVLNTPRYVAFGFVLTYNVFFLVCILYLAFRTRKIEQKRFKDTKKINIFVVLLVVTLTLQFTLSIPLSLSHHYWQGNFVFSVSNLFLALSVLVILFLPKLLPSMFKPKPPIRRRSTRRSSSKRRLAGQMSASSFFY